MLQESETTESVSEKMMQEGIKLLTKPEVPKDEVLNVLLDLPECFKFDKVAFFGRTFDEYVAMFGLDPMKLHPSLEILDCSSGPAAFVATGTSKYGLHITGADPRYGHSPAELRAIGKQNLDTCLQLFDQFPTTFTLSTCDKFKQDKIEAMESFLTDFECDRSTLAIMGDKFHKSRYVPASLPELPFQMDPLILFYAAISCSAMLPKEDGGMMGMDIGEISKLLGKPPSAGDTTENTKDTVNAVATTPVFDLDFHLRAVTELARVCRGELRLVPTRTMETTNRQHPYVSTVIELLTHDLGFNVALIPCDYNDGFHLISEVMVATRIADSVTVEPVKKSA